MKYRYGFLLFLIAFMLQSSVMSHLRIFGAAPNLILCGVIVTAFMYEGYLGLVFGVIFGVLQDLCFSEIIGPGAITYFIIFFVLKELRRYLYRDNMLSLFLANMAGTIAYFTILWGIITLFQGYYTFLHMAWRIPVLILYHFGIILVYYLLIGRKSIKHPQDKLYSEGFVGNIRITR